VADRVGQVRGLEIDAQLRQIEEVGQRDRRHREAPARLGARQPLRHQVRQRLAQGADRGVVALAQFAEAQALIGLERQHRMSSRIWRSTAKVAASSFSTSWGAVVATGICRILAMAGQTPR
jgi:hypothetical protein